MAASEAICKVFSYFYWILKSIHLKKKKKRHPRLKRDSEQLLPRGVLQWVQSGRELVGKDQVTRDWRGLKVSLEYKLTSGVRMPGEYCLEQNPIVTAIGK